VRINTNIAAVNTQRNLNSVQSSLAKSVERLSSGLRINRAGDDAAGLTISEKLRGQVKGLNQAVRNAQDGISMIQTAEGGLNESHAILQRMRELAVQGANETLTTQDRQAIGSELQSLTDEIDRIATDTEFNTKKLLTGGVSTKIATASEIDATGSLASSNGSTYSVDVTQAIASANGVNGQNYTFSGSGSSLTLSATLANGQTVAQTLTLAASQAANTSQTLDFSELGIKLTLNANANAVTNANVIADFVTAGGNDTITIDPASKAVSFQVGANQNQTVGVSINSAASDMIGTVDGVNTTSLKDAVADFKATYSTADANALIGSLDQAIKNVSDSRSNLGAVQNRLEHTIENLATSSENLQASESRIRDADMAAEMVGFTRSNILQQAGTSILAQANQLPQGVLSLLR
jgi:flagellin